MIYLSYLLHTILYITNDYYKMLRVFKISKEQSIKIKNKTEEFLKDKELVKRIEAIYDGMIKIYNKDFISKKF